MRNFIDIINEASKSNGIEVMGGSTIYADGLIDEENKNLHYAVPLIWINSEGNQVKGHMPLVHPEIIFSAARNKGIIFKGAALFDADSSKMRFMLRGDAIDFANAFSKH